MNKTVYLSIVSALLLFTGTLASATVVSFQEGVNGYDGNDATYIFAPNFSTVHDHLNFMNTGGSANAALVRFRDIFGSGTNQIQTGATINSATLTLTTLGNWSNEVNNVFAIETDWVASTTTFQTFAGGTSLSALQSKLSDSPVASFTPNQHSTGFDIDITALMQSWSDGALSNNGVAIQNLGGDSAQFATDNISNLVFRPVLTVDYEEIAVPAPATVLLLIAGLAGLLIRRRH